MGAKRLVFSSSASIYDVVPGFMVTEEAPLKPSSPYARTKFMMEMILHDFCAAYDMHGIALRYFNPIGADPKMRTGLHVDNPSHILGRMVDVQIGQAGALHHHRYRLPHTRRHGHPRLHPLFGIWRART